MILYDHDSSLVRFILFWLSRSRAFLRSALDSLAPICFISAEIYHVSSWFALWTSSITTFAVRSTFSPDLFHTSWDLSRGFFIWSPKYIRALCARFLIPEPLQASCLLQRWCLIVAPSLCTQSFINGVFHARWNSSLFPRPFSSLFGFPKKYSTHTLYLAL